MAPTEVSPLEILRNAVDMELEGKEFFEKAAARMQNVRARDMFLSLVKQEQRHVDILSSELSRLEQGQGWASLADMKAGAPRVTKMSVFKDGQFRRFSLREDAGELEVIRLGMDVEKKSVEYYRSAGQATPDTRAKEVFNWLVGEEAGHLTILSAEYDNRSGSGFYYDSPEFSLEVF